MGTNGTTDLSIACAACNQHHPRGYCPLKLAGVEHCPLCGLAHFGKNRSCPHLQSEAQVRLMLVALSKSREHPEQVALAKKYLRGILGHLSARARQAAAQQSQPPDLQCPIQAPQPAAPIPSSTHGPETSTSAPLNTISPHSSWSEA
jgi:hypothetical protein